MARCAGHRSRLLVLGDELLDQPLVQLVHARAVRAGLPRELVRVRVRVRVIREVTARDRVRVTARVRVSC